MRSNFRSYLRSAMLIGTAAGLTVAGVALLTEAMGGTVEVSNLDGGGALFTVSLPAEG
jgi:signal transduction histidine kinase